MAVALAPGSAAITVLAREDTTVAVTAAVTVIPAVRVLLVPTADTLAAGDSIRLDAKVIGSRDRAVRWSSSAPTVVTIDDAGTGRAISAGNATVTAAANADTGARADASIRVPPFRISVAGGDHQVGLVGSALADSIVVRVSSLEGTPASGVRVRWTAGSEGGSAEPSDTVTDAEGIARTRWLLPARAGAATVSVNVAGLNGRITATARPAAPLKMLAPDTHSYISAVGTVRTAVFLIDFSDAVATISPDEVHRKVVDPAVSLFSDFSAGRMQLVPSGPRRWIRMPRTAAEYDVGGLTQWDWLTRDLLVLTDPEIDFSTYDQIYLVFSNTAPPRQSGVSTWPEHFAVYKADGREIRVMVLLCAEAYSAGYPPGHIALHENAHGFGLPDLYPLPDAHLPPKTSFAGSWDPMADLWRDKVARDFMAVSKARLGWLDSTQVKSLAAGGLEQIIAPITAPDGVKAVAIPLDSTSVLMAEVRDGSGRDAGLCRIGVLLYVFDRSIPTGFGPVRVIPAHPDASEVLTCSGLYNAPFQPGESYTHPSGATVEVLERAAGGYRVRVRIR